MGLLILNFLIRVSRGVVLGGESAYPLRSHMLSLLAFVVKLELSGLLEVVRRHRF